MTKCKHENTEHHRKFAWCIDCGALFNTSCMPSKGWQLPKHKDKKLEAIQQEWFEKGQEYGKIQLLKSLHELLRTYEITDWHEEVYHEKED